MDPKPVIKSQFKASLAMLRQAIEKCPDALWTDASYKNPFWRVAYHTLIYTHFYLGPSEDDFVPWEKHQQDLQLLGQEIPGMVIYRRVEVLDYLALVLDQVDLQVEAMDLAAESVSIGCRLISWNCNSTISAMSSSTPVSLRASPARMARWRSAGWGWAEAIGFAGNPYQ